MKGITVTVEIPVKRVVGENDNLINKLKESMNEDSSEDLNDSLIPSLTMNNFNIEKTLVGL